jgi:hypothetical protein
MYRELTERAHVAFMQILLAAADYPKDIDKVCQE